MIRSASVTGPDGAAEQVHVPMGLLSADPSDASGFAANALNALPEVVTGFEVVLDLGAYYWALRLASATCPPALLRLTARSAEESAVLRAFPLLLSVKFTPLGTGAAEGAEAAAEQRLTLTQHPSSGEAAPGGPAPGGPASVLLEARLCTKAVISTWMRVFSDLKLCLALDLDDTVLKAFRGCDLDGQVNALCNDRDVAELAYVAAKRVRARGSAFRWGLGALVLALVEERAASHRDR